MTGDHEKSLISRNPGRQMSANPLSILYGDAIGFDDASVVELIWRAAEIQGDAVAVDDSYQFVTYAELVRRGTALASELCDQGTSLGATVVMNMERSVDAIVTLVAILKAGAVAVLTDPASPKERLDYILHDSSASLLLTSAGSDVGGETLSCGVEGVVAARPSRGSSYQSAPGAAYIIYTSGSTGTPKGVEVSHAALSHSTQARFHCYERRAASFLLLSPLAFDSALAGIFWTLCQAGKLFVPPVLEPLVLDALEESPVYTLCTPSFYETYLSDVADRGSHVPEHFPQNVIVAGETCRRTLVAKHHSLAHGIGLYNEYGPTEACVWTTVTDLDDDGSPDQSPSIGRPIPNTAVVVCDEDGHPVGAGESGEICIVGPGLATRYVNLPHLTRERFRPAPLAGAPTMYRTGDIGRVRGDGKLECLGRADNQVKLRGLRIEIEEVEHQLASAPGVKQAAVAVVETPVGAQLVGFVTLGRSRVSCESVRATVARRLPSWMVPVRLQSVDRLPVTSTGKLDRAALAEHALDTWKACTRCVAGGEVALLDATGAGADEDESANELAQRIAAIWRDLLETDAQLGPEADFFLLGGQSLLASRVVARVKRELGAHVTVRDLFDFPTLTQFASRVVNRSAAVSVS